MKVGILGGGQLGLMLARAARDLDMDSLVLDPKPDAVAGQVAEHLAVDWSDEAALEMLAACDVVTYEFENVPTATVERLVELGVPVHPSPASLARSGDRLDEKNLFRSLGIDTAPFAELNERADLDRAIERIGLPAILKTRRFGYDGKGQAVLRSPDDVDAGWERLGDQPLILEGFVPFDRELSVAAVRGRDGTVRHWPATENQHVDGILHLSRAPAENLSPALFEAAYRGVEALMAKLDYVGVLVVELFQIGESLVANEMACRVHNSTHWTIEGSPTSQFENHMRAVAGLPLGDTRETGPAAMINLVGQIPDLDALAGDPEIYVHVYGKSPAPGRKLGHVTVVASDREGLEDKIRRVLDVVGDRAEDAAS